MLLLTVSALATRDRAPPGARARPARSALDHDDSYRQVLLVPRPVTVAPGVHQLGAMSLSAVYAIETSTGLVLVDAGLEEDHDLLIRQMVELGLEPDQVEAILLTHAHGDHSLGAMPLKRRFGAAIYAGKDDARALREGGPHEAIFSMYDMPESEVHATDVDVELAGGEMLAFGDTRIEVIAAPGHTPGSTCFVLNRGGSRIFFAGDTVMASRVLGTYPAYLSPRYRGDARAFLATLRKLSALPTPDIVLPGHPRDDRLPQHPRVAPAQWTSMLDRGIKELEELIERQEADGPDFLDGVPKELLPGLYYLGDLDSCAEYVLATPSELLLFDAPGGPGLPEWLDSRLRETALGSRPLTAVLLTSCGQESTSGLAALVETTSCRVVSSEAGAAVLRRLGVPDTRLLPVESLWADGWIDVRTVPLADVRPGAMAYIFPWCGKTVLVSGRTPVQEGAAGRATLEHVLAGRPEDIGAYQESLYRLLDVNPNLWLPAEPLHGRNANLYSTVWSHLLSYSISKLRYGVDRPPSSQERH